MVSTRLMLNIELLRKLASFGNEGQVIAPQRVEHSLAEFHQAAC